MKVHNHSEQFDSHMHPVCGRGQSAVTSKVFEATDPKDRCKFCERDWFPNGQPTWHLKQAKSTLKGK